MTLKLAIGIAAAMAAAASAAEVGPIVITEIMYNPHGTDDGQEWVEIYNPSATSVSLAGWYLQNGSGQTTTFATGTTLAARSLAVIVPRRGGVSGNGTTRASTYVNSAAAFAAAWGPGVQLIFVESLCDYPGDPVPVTGTLGGLSNSPDGTTDMLQLIDNRRRVVDEVAYRDDEGTETPWPDDDDGGSIQLLRDFTGSYLDNNNGAAWRLSQAADPLGSVKANTVNPQYSGLVSYGTPGRLPNAWSVDCNANGVNDAVDIVRGTAADIYPYNNIPDSCEGNCDGALGPDRTQILLDWRQDRNHNLVVDACEINARGGVAGRGGTWDVNANGILDSFENKPRVMITEIMYDPAGADDGKEYVEIHNYGTTAVNIGGWALQDLEGDPASGLIPAGTTMQPGEVIVLHAGDGPGVPLDVAAQFRQSWAIPAGVRTFALVPWQDRAQRATAIEEVLALVDATGEPVDVANYEVAGEVPTTTWPANDGASSIYVLPTALGNKDANDVGSNWTLSIAGLDGARYGLATSWFTDSRLAGSVGSPGTVWTAPRQSPSGQAVITEIMYNPNSSYQNGRRNEWVEIFNPGGVQIDLSGWYLRDEDGRTGGAPAGSVLRPNAVAVLVPMGASTNVAQVQDDFRAAWGAICDVIPLTNWSDLDPLPNLGSLTNSPSPGKEILTLRRADGGVVDIVNYDDDGTVWPADAVVSSPGAGTSWSIALKPGFYTATANDRGANWEASVQGVNLADVNAYTAVFNGFDIGSPGLLPGVVLDVACPPPPTCLADFNQDGGVDGGDIESFFRSWMQGDSAADINQDGGVDGMDVESFFVLWQAGC